MVDFGTILFTAGVNLVGKLLFKWISEGRSSVRTSLVEREIAAEAAIEAERQRLRPDDLERASQAALKEIVERSPHLSFAKSGMSSGLRMAFDPKDPNSSKQLMVALRQRIDQIEKETRGPVVLPPGAALAPPEKNPAVPAQGAEARKMLDTLKARVDQRETDRT
jgi:hypothetical protein